MDSELLLVHSREEDNTREVACALTKLDEAEMWLQRHINRHE